MPSAALSSSTGCSRRWGFNEVCPPVTRLLFLVLDTVLTRPVKIYPPKDTRTLHDLYQQILDSKMSEQHKLSALYYLLLDHDEGMAARSKLSDNFASQMRMTRRYQIFMSGLWHMDRLQFKVRVLCLHRAPSPFL